MRFTAVHATEKHPLTWNNTMGHSTLFLIAAGVLLAAGCSPSRSPSNDKPLPAVGTSAAVGKSSNSGTLPDVAAAVNAANAATVAAFNKADAAGLASQFAPSGELVDENGGVHSGRQAIRELFTKFFERFPKAQLALEAESVRAIDDDLAIEEGVRLVTAGEGTNAARVRYMAVREKEGGEWLIASYREFADDPPPSAQEMLGQLGWLVGEWVDESPEGRTTISYRWSEDGSYLLGDYNLSVGGQPTSKSQQRIGWDAVELTLRSWTFDSDGGFSEGEWTPDDGGWVVKSVATLPDGTTGSATLTLSPTDADHVTILGTDRVVAGQVEPDFKLMIARKPPRPDAEGR